MAKSDYAEGRKKHLKEYAQRKNMPIGGSWQGKGEYDYILKFTKDKNSARSKQNRYEMVCEYNILDSVDTTKFKQKDMHSFAHHLNSSQVLCYNFFRPLITKESHPTTELINLLSEKLEITISPDAKCAFEYCPDKEENTQFDFYIQDDTNHLKLYFEIKYTEYGFGKAEDDESHRDKFQNTYLKKFLPKACCLKNQEPQFEEFAESYQLYRNAVRITDEKKYLILLYPEKNTVVAHQANEFIKKNISKDYQKNIKCIHWEDIANQNPKLYEKYFA